MGRAIGLATCALLLLCAGCDGPGPDPRPWPVGDLEAFEQRVMPHLAERCASGGCHGDPDRPLSLYAPGAHRADPRRLHLDEPLTQEELVENARRVRAFALTAPVRDTLIVRKPLAPAAGGLWHGGGDVFADERDPGCRELVRWLRTAQRVDGGAP